jgi:hypothetical protein
MGERMRLFRNRCCCCNQDRLLEIYNNKALCKRCLRFSQEQSKQIWEWIEHHQDEAERDFDNFRSLFRNKYRL